MGTLFYVVMYVCVGGVCDPHVVSEAKPLAECLIIRRQKEIEYKKLDENVMGSCLPNTDFE